MTPEREAMLANLPAPDPVYTMTYEAALATIRRGAPGLTELSCAAIAGQIAMKVTHRLKDMAK